MPKTVVFLLAENSSERRSLIHHVTAPGLKALYWDDGIWTYAYYRKELQKGELGQQTIRVVHTKRAASWMA